MKLVDRAFVVLCQRANCILRVAQPVASDRKTASKANLTESLFSDIHRRGSGRNRPLMIAIIKMGTISNPNRLGRDGGKKKTALSRAKMEPDSSTLRRLRSVNHRKILGADLSDSYINVHRTLWDLGLGTLIASRPWRYYFGSGRVALAIEDTGKGEEKPAAQFAAVGQSSQGSRLHDVVTGWAPYAGR